jgi:predicted enzyme related to lactoylglutathione lyase
MRVNRIIADLLVDDVASAQAFYIHFLGLRTEFDLGWVARLTHPETGAVVQLLSRDAGAGVDPVVSVLVEDVDEAYADAVAQGHEIVHPLTTEEWGVRRFFVRAPDGNVFNVVHHPA